MKPTLNICSVSGGKDSTALYCLMVETHGQNFLPIFSDTGHEHPVTLNYVRNLHILAGGPPVVFVQADFANQIRMRRHARTKELRKLHIGSIEYTESLKHARKMRPTGNRFLDLMIWKNAVPTGKLQFCTEHLKLWPQKFYLEANFPNHEWFMHLGIRNGESKARSLRQPFEINTFFDCMAVLPLASLTTEDVFALLKSYGVPPNPLYALGHDRVGCFPCIHANKSQLSNLPDWAWDKLKWFETRLGITWFHKETIDQAREWSKTSHGGSQYNMFKGSVDDAPSCMSDWSICE